MKITGNRTAMYRTLGKRVFTQQILESSTIDDVGSWCVKGWWSRAAIRHEEGGIHGNPASGHHQRHRHTESNQWNTYQRKGKAWKLSRPK